MAKLVETSSGIVLTLSDIPFAAGGEAELYRITKPANRRGQVAKIYKPDKRTADRDRKITFLTQHPPDGLLADDGHHQAVVWPVEAVRERGRFAGFVMADAPGEKLELLCLPTLPPALRPTWGRFDRSRPDSRALRLKLCFNLAVAVFQVHQSGRYVLVDMKPDNIIVRLDGLVSLVDLDSVQVIDDRQLLFAAPVTTPEYSPADPVLAQGGQPEPFGLAWDRFSMAVIFYRLLCGIHPFTGTAKPPLDRQTDTAGMIQHGLFPNGRRAADFAVVPTPHRLFGQLPPAVQRLFRHCFDDGQTDPSARPSADDWCRALSGQAGRGSAGPMREARLLPSMRLTGPDLTPTTALKWPLSLPPDVPTVTFADLDAARTFWGGLMQLIGQSGGPAYRQSAVLAQARVKQMLADLSVYEKEFSRIIKTQASRQRGILTREAADLKMIQAAWLKSIADLDVEAKADTNAEAQAVRLARLPVDEALQPLDSQRQAMYARLVGRLEADMARQQAQLQTRAEALANAEEQARQRAMFHPKKLVGYRIETDKKTIFKSNQTAVIQALARAGIQTAADFMAVRDGQFQRPGRGWVKIAGVGRDRAKALMAWRQHVEASHDALLQTMIDTQFAPQHQQLRAERQAVQTRADHALAEARDRFKQDTALITSQIETLSQQADALATTASAPYDEREAHRLQRGQQAQEAHQGRANQRRLQTDATLQKIVQEVVTRYETLRRNYLTDRAQLLTAIDQMRQVETAYLG